jgi:DNA-binding HxlR family transcriptional regulator
VQQQQALSPAEVRASLCGERDCPLLDAPAQDAFRASVKATNAFSMKVSEFLAKRAPTEQAAWVQRSLAASRPLLQPWTLEVLYAVASAGTARFTSLQELLGLSSRTLATRLKDLQASGLLERRVVDATPVHTEYRLTKAGRATAALAAPLFAHLNQSLADRQLLPRAK